MSSYLLDTNHVSPLVTGGHPLCRQFFQRLRGGDNFGISIPVIAEFLFGIGMTPKAVQNLQEWERLRPLVRLYIPNEQDAVSGAELQVKLRKRGRQIGTVDALIAAVALRYNLILLTTDRDFQAVPNLAQRTGCKVNSYGPGHHHL